MTEAEKKLLQDIDLDCAVNYKHLVDMRRVIYDALKRACTDRDAALEELRKLGSCGDCAFGETREWNEPPCDKCREEMNGPTGWKWRRIKE